MADRSVSINLRARVAGFVAGMGQAQKETTNLGRKMVETGASADRMRQRLEAATRALPKIEIDADSTPAEIKFAELRAQMESLADKRIGIDIDADAARAQLAEIERELEALQRSEVDINVRADLGTALSELRALDGEVSKVDGRTANVNVNADVGGALAGIAAVAGALASLPAVTTVAVGVTALGSAFAAAGLGAASFAAVAVPSLGRVNEALKAQESAAKAAGGATGGAGQSAAQAAVQAMQLEAAEKRLADAQRDEKQAQEDLTRAREAGRRALEDMNFSLERSVLSQKDAALAVREAEARLAKLQAEGADPLEIERAMLSLEQAQQRAEEQEVRTARAKKDTAEANKKGVEGTKEYQKGLDQLRQAQDRVAQAEMQLAQLRAQSSGGGGGGGGGGLDKLAEAMAKLSKAERALLKDMKDFGDAYLAWQRALQPDVLPVISQGLSLMEQTLPRLTPFVQSSSAAFSTLLTEAEKALAGPFWTQFAFNLNTVLPGAIIGLGRSFGNITTGVAGIIDAFLPFAPTVVGGIESATAAFSEWGQSLKNSPEFAEFIEFVKVNAPQAWELIKNLASALGNIVEAVAPLGVGSMAGLNLLAQLVAGMDPGHIQAIAVALVAIKVAHAGLSAVSAWKGLADNVGLLGGAAGKTTGKVAALGKAMLGIGAGVLVLQGVGSAVSAIEGQSKGIDRLTLALTELGQTGKWAGDLEDQWVGVFDKAGTAAEGFRDGLRELNDPSLYERLIDHPFTELGAVLPGIDSAVDRLEQRFADMDQTLAGMVSSGNLAGAQAAFAQMTEEAAKAGVPVEKLQELFPLYSQSVRVAGHASTEAAAGIDQAKQKLDGFQTSMDAFTARTDVLQAMANVKKSYEDAAVAIEAANGKLSVSKGMNDQQRDAVVRAREAFSGYITAIKTAADGAATLSGKQTEGSRVIAEQLPKLAELAGKSTEAKAQILLLAQAYGLSAEDAKKAMRGGQDLKEVLDKIKSKEIKIEADTKAAKEQLDAFLKSLLNIKPIAIPYYLQAQGSTAPVLPGSKPKAWGGISSVSGTEYMAAGGIRDLGASAPAMIVRSPHRLSGRSGPDVVFGEAGAEAYIPLSPAKRARGLEVLSATANIMGQTLVPSSVSNTSSVSNLISSTAMTIGGARSSTVNSSRVSRPVQMSGSWSGGSGAAPAPAGESAGGQYGGGGRPGSMVTVQGDLVVREQADADLVAERLHFKAMSRG
ncbi:hypothetical protein HS041_12355 [Planomonospora sp. ID67723]|uniref:hypothetical protein n=1 Tax=Planomonospora sp. ID67723 TaxID=2738134 RepID=UPI0018C352C6|nr:hypothetical protein [Planomonospora sp. ID67723]MBG0828561.1 hypothetical protein [Planomonospora sp. ID67723]